MTEIMDMAARKW